MPRLVNCIFHTDNNASLALYEETESYYCWGCGKTGKLSDIEHKIDYDTEYVPVSKEHKEDYKQLTDWGLKFFKSRKIKPEVAFQYGILELTGRSLLFPVYNRLGQTTGYQIRFFDGKFKYKTLPVDGVYPRYGEVFNHNPDVVYLVESIIDALSIYSRQGVGSYVMLGTNLHTELLELLRKEDREIKVYLDDDAVLKSYAVIADKLKHIYNRRVSVIDTDLKPYE